MAADMRGTATWGLVEDHVRRSMSPAFGTAYTGIEPAATADGSRIAFTGSVLEQLEGLPRSGVFTVEGEAVVEITNGSGSARLPTFSPDGTTLSFLSDRA